MLESELILGRGLRLGKRGKGRILLVFDGLSREGMHLKMHFVLAALRDWKACSRRCKCRISLKFLRSCSFLFGNRLEALSSIRSVTGLCLPSDRMEQV